MDTAALFEINIVPADAAARKGGLTSAGTVTRLGRLTHWGRDEMDDILQTTFSSAFSWTFVPMGPIDNIPALVQIMVWRRQGAKPLSEPMKVS